MHMHAPIVLVDAHPLEQGWQLHVCMCRCRSIQVGARCNAATTSGAHLLLMMSGSSLLMAELSWLIVFSPLPLRFTCMFQQAAWEQHGWHGAGPCVPHKQRIAD